MRICWPTSSRSFGSARLPFTRTSPLRMMRWMWLNESPGNRASKKRSTRMPDSSAADGDGLHAGGDLGKRRRRFGIGLSLTWPDVVQMSARAAVAARTCGRAACAHRSYSCAHPSPRRAHPCASAVQPASAAFHPGGRTILSACDLRKTCAAYRALQMTLARRLRYREIRAPWCPGRRMSPSACAIQTSAGRRHASPMARNHGVFRNWRQSPGVPIPCRSCAPRLPCGQRRADGFHAFFMGISASRCVRRSR